jgi:hypothetical protein
MRNKLLLLLAIGIALSTQTLMAQVPSYVPTNGLVGYWPFSGNANDESGNGNNGTVNGATLTTDRYGNANSAYNFITNSDIIQNQNFNMTSQNFTISVWAKLLTTYSYTLFNVVEFGPIDNTTIGGFSLRIDQNNSVYGNNMYQIYGITNNEIHSDSYEFNLLNIWNNIIFTKDGENTRLYLNGQLISSNIDAGTISYANSWLQFGNKGNINNNLVGSRLIDDIGIWNRALTQQEITNLYNSVSTNECLTMTINTGALSTNPVTYTSTVNIYPNPANDQITIDCGNLANVAGWNIKITNMLGQEVFNKPMNTQQYVVPLNTWSGKGMYFVKISNAQNEVVNIKKIILQ